MAACNKIPSGSTVIIITPASSGASADEQRAEGFTLLATDSQILESCYTQTFTYANCPHLNKISDSGAYKLDQRTHITDDKYTLVINNDDAPLADLDCETMTMDQTGNKTATDASGKDTSQECYPGSSP